MRHVRRSIKNLLWLCLFCVLGYYIYSKYAGESFERYDFLSLRSTAPVVATETPIPSDTVVTDVTTTPYYTQLNEVQQSLYQEIYTGAANLEEYIIPSESINTTDVETTFMSVYCDHPELFWLDSKYSYRSLSDSETVVSITLSYYYTADAIEEEKEKFDSEVNSILEEAKQYTSNYDREKKVHDLMIERTEYNSQADMNQSAYSAIVNRSTVCAGYARSFQYLMQQLDIPCYYVIGTSEGQDHAWNIVLIDGVFYNVDLTWDDCSSDNDPYYFFNLDDESFDEYHTRDQESQFLPNCTDSSLAHVEDEAIYRNIRFSFPN